MRDRREDIERAGARLILVGNGSVAHARSFQKRLAPDVDVYTDPGRQSYDRLGLRRSVAATLGPSSASAFIGATLKGHRQTSIEGDAWQQGGLLVMAPDGGILFLQRNRTAGDRPDVEGALRSLRPDAQGAGRRRRPALR